MNRREFIAGLGATALPVVARAQQPAMPVIGFLNSISSDESGIPAFRRGLSEFGYVEGRNVLIEYRHADGDYDRLPGLAAELKSLSVRLIVASPSVPAALALRTVASTIPIVFLIGADPVQLGLVESYSRPGGNMTGIVFMANELTAKRVGLLHELLPESVPIAFLTNPSNSIAGDVVTTASQAARAVGRELIVVGATNKSEIEAAFEAMGQQGAGGLVVWQEAYFALERKLITTLAAHHSIPAIYGPRLFPEVGGLMSYGANRDELYRLTGGYAARVLQGTKPADLPVMQAAKFELVINLRTAMALGLTIPETLLATADEVIQ